METLLLIIGIVAVALVLLRPAPRTQIIYVPVEVTQERGEETSQLANIVSFVGISPDLDIAGCAWYGRPGVGAEVETGQGEGRWRTGARCDQRLLLRGRGPPR